MTQILTARQDRVLRVTLNRPDRRNLLDLAAIQSLDAALDEANLDPSVGSILLDAAGSVFCAGFDWAALDPSLHPTALAVQNNLFTFRSRFRKPVVAAAQGGVLSPGIGLLANAHVVLAAQGTQFGVTDIRAGQWPHLVHRTLSAAIGERRATELVLTGRAFGVNDALQFGLVHEVTPSFELDDRASAVAHALSNFSSTAIQSGLAPDSPES